MKIVFDSRCFFEQKTGVGHYAYGLLKALLETDSANAYTLFYGLTAKSSRKPLSEFKKEGVTNILIRWPGRLFDIFVDRFPSIPVDRLIGDYDVFHCPNFVPPPLKGNVVITVHDMAYQLYPSFFPETIRRSLTRHLDGSARMAKRIIADSENTKKDITKYLNFDSRKISVVHPAAGDNFKPMDDFTLIESVKQQYGIDGNYIGFFATLEPRKNAVALVQAYNILKKRIKGFGHKLVLAGSPGWQNEDVFSYITSLGLTNDVLVTGYVPDDDLPVLLNGAAVSVYPSLYEGFGLPPLEAMACGTPVITSNTSSLPEVVGDAGIMVDPEDIVGLADAIESVLSDEKLKQEMSRKGLARAKLFSWDKAARETLKIYKDVAG
jgi:glycosyltransferase involved in cell wall biosynthesis